MDLPAETFTAAEEARLAPHVTSLHAPVFALVNLPETVKGALFARYSRHPGTLRRLFLDEFAESLPALPPFEGDEGERAAKLYDTIFLGYGDDSVAQLGAAHVACEWVSNVLTKILQRPRIGVAYLEQSTRYIAYDAPMNAAGRVPLLPRPGAGAGLRARRWTASSTPTRTRSPACRRGRPSSGRRRPASRRRRTHAPCARRRSTSCAGCCPRRRSRTWGCSPPARRTSRSSCTSWRTRCPRRAGAGGSCSRPSRRSCRRS